MKRVLLIAYYYPPSPAVGALRPKSLAKYLPQFGWEPIILTPCTGDAQRQDARVVETPYRDVLGEWKTRLHLDPVRGLHEQLHLPLSSKSDGRRLHTRVVDWAKALIAFPDPMKGWIPYALQAVEQLPEKETIDAILTTSPPVSCQMIGARAQARLGCPWIADYRDLWSINNRFTQHFERNILSNASVLVTVSEPLAGVLRRCHPWKTISWITNSFDPEDFPASKGPLTSQFSITYTGQLWQGHQDPTLLFDVLRELIAEGIMFASDISIRFYGPQQPFLHNVVQRSRLDSLVEINNPIPRNAALARQRESQLLLLLDWCDPRQSGVYTGKVFEYLGAKRPILATGPIRGVIADLLQETGAGVQATSKSELRTFLVKYYTEWRSSGRLEYRGDDLAIARYTSPQMAQKFAEILDKAVEDTPPMHVKDSLKRRVIP